MKRSYKLLKDLPNVSKGVHFHWCNTDNWITPHKDGRYICDMKNKHSCNIVFTPKDMKNINWFKPLTLKETKLVRDLEGWS